MRIYIDNCCFNRPYDNQIYDIIRLETEAKIFVQNCIKDNKIELVWSFILDFENSANPYKERRESIKEWRSISAENIKPTEKIRNYANELKNLYGIKPKDSLHVACAIEAKCKYFLTTDKILIKKTMKLKEIKAINPLEFITLLEGK
ncbi:MAG: PIN domain-containing protein [Desulfobacterales bacterium]|nr:PIN domain-containing protein [Desulfobacterales bacterium]